MTAEDIITLVMENVQPGEWDEDGTSIEAANGFLFVRHTKAVQREVAAFLAGLGH